MNSVQNLSRQTRGRVGSKNAQTRCQIRQLFPSRLKTLPGVPLGVCANDCRPAALRKACGVISQGLDRGNPELGRSPRRRISGIRLSNTLAGCKTGRVKNAVTLILRNYHGNCESYPRQRVNSLWLVASVLRDSKSSEPRPQWLHLHRRRPACLARTQEEP